MTKTSIRYRYKRLDHSEYHKKEFLRHEEKSLYDLPYMDKDSKNLILITNSKTNVQNIDKLTLENTKLMIHPNSGYDNFSYDFVKNASFPIIVGNPVRANAVSNYILSCIFDFYSPIPKSNKWDIDRQYKRPLLNELNILIVGFGHIGKILNNSLKEISCNATVFDPFKTVIAEVNKEKQIEELQLENYDAILMAASLNPTSCNIIDSKILKRLKKDCLIINAARGGLINENHLMEFLKENPNSFAYLDVFKKEPYIDKNGLWPKNCLKTSHIAGVFTNLDEAIINFEKVVINSYISSPRQILSKEQPLNLFNRLNGNYLI